MKTKLALLALTSLAVGTIASAARPDQPMLGRIYIEPLVIHNIQPAGKVRPIDEPATRAKLNQQFDTWIARSVTRMGLAQLVEPADREHVAADGYVLHTVMNVPLTHRDISNVDLQYQTGN